MSEVDEADEWDALAGAFACVVSSKLESLSLVTVEAFAVGTPVLGHAHSPVVAGQLQRSGGGLTYADAKSFAQAVQWVGVQREALAVRAQAFAAQQRWRPVMDAWERALEEASTEGRRAGQPRWPAAPVKERPGSLHRSGPAGAVAAVQDRAS